MGDEATDETNPLHAMVTYRRRRRCGCCRRRMVRLTGEVHEADGVPAWFIASLYKHRGVREVYLDIIAGRGPDDPDDDVTFTTRTGPIERGGEIGSTMIDGGATWPDDPEFGRKLTREEALASPDVSRYWALSDAILDVDEITRHVY